MADLVTIIGENMRVSGRLTGSEDLRVFGLIEGSLELSESLLVESTGIVKAEVAVRSAIISGVVVGNVVATDVVEITAEGRMVGDITAPRVILTEGAAFRGHIDMGSAGDADVAESRSTSARRTERRSTPSRDTNNRTASARTWASTPRASSAPATPAVGSPRAATTTATATTTTTTTVVEEDEAETTNGATDGDLISVDEFRALGWNKGRSYIKSKDINLEYSGFDELVDAYETFLSEHDQS